MSRRDGDKLLDYGTCPQNQGKVSQTVKTVSTISQAQSNDTVILLTYYYDYELHSHRLFKSYIKDWLGAYLPFTLYLYEPLVKIFSRVVVYDYLERILQVGVKAVNQEIIDLTRRERPKYVIWTSWLYDIQESTLETIRKDGTIVIGWFFDDEWRFDDYSKFWIPYLDYCVTSDMDAIPKYGELGGRAIYTVPNTGVAIDRDQKDLDERYGVSFVGSRFYGDREQWMDELRKRNIEVELFGEGWTGYIPFEKMIDIFKSSKINLNFSGTPAHHRLQIKGRMFQVCMAGGFLLTEYVPGIERYFEPDKEIVCFDSVEDLTDKIAYYLEHEKERQAITEAGWKRAINAYTSSRMVSKVFAEIEQDLKDGGRQQKEPAPGPSVEVELRRKFSGHYLRWGKVFLKENYRGLWRDALSLSLSYRRFNATAQGYRIAGLFPSMVRPTLLGLCHVYEKLSFRPFAWLRRTVLKI
ncbi:glycosyltransferase [Chloroflexota bacterium]